LLQPLIPIKPGAKAPPLLQKWPEATPAGLKEAVAANAGCNLALRLDNYLALDPDNLEAAAYLEQLEQEGFLSATWTWATWRKMKIRLYQRPEGLSPMKVKKDGMKLEVRTGSGQYCLIPHSGVNGKHYEWLPGPSPDDICITDLPTATLQLLAKAAQARKESCQDAGLEDGGGAAPSTAFPKNGREATLMMERCRPGMRLSISLQ
jgi:hypothetical protein